MLTRQQRAKAAAAVPDQEENSSSDNRVLMGENNESLNDDLEDIVAAEEQQNGSGGGGGGEDDSSDRGSVGSNENNNGDGEILDDEHDGGQEELEEEEDDDDHEENVFFFGPFQRGGGTLADHMRLARYMYDDDADDDDDFETEVDIDLDVIVDHPYLQERYPERPRTMRNIMAYEYNFLRYDQNYDDTLQYKNGRVSETCLGLSNIHNDIAILDHLEHFQFLECTSLPENFKYLTNLRKFSFMRCTRSIASPPGVLETMHGVRRLCFQESSMDILNDLVNLPAVDSVTIQSVLSPNGSGPGSQLAGLSAILRRLRRRGSNRSIFRNNMKTFIFNDFRLSDTQLSEVVIAVIETFPNVTSICLNGVYDSCIFSPRAVEILAMDLKERIKNDKHFLTKMERIDLTCSSMFKSKEGLRAVIELLRVMGSINHVGDWLKSIYSYESDSNDDTFKGLEISSRFAIYRERTAELNDQEWKRLRLKLITMLNQVYQRRFLKDLNNASGGHQVTRCPPLSIWSHAVHKASIMRPRFKTKDATLRYEESRVDDELPPPSPWDEATEEVKMWRASAVYLLLREGLTGNDDWHERRSSAKPHHGRKRKTCK